MVCRTSRGGGASPRFSASGQGASLGRTEALPHGERRAEASLLLAGETEATGRVESSRWRAGDDMQGREAPIVGQSFGLPDQPGADAASPTPGLDEEAIKFGGAVVPRQNDHEADDFAVALGDVDAPLLD